ncbi:hypothetical protein AUC45_06425 [Erythrobacter sp. YT30]|nr:hypothetical protein AUC45_06425 [Erythrobacter sp. YT30]
MDRFDLLDTERSMKKAYEKPAIEKLGSFETMTQAANPGGSDDMGFARTGGGDGPPDMTFS